MEASVEACICSDLRSVGLAMQSRLLAILEKVHCYS